MIWYLKDCKLQVYSSAAAAAAVSSDSSRRGVSSAGTMTEQKEVEVTEMWTSRPQPHDAKETGDFEAEAAEQKEAMSMFARHFQQAGPSQVKARMTERAKRKAAEQREQDIFTLC